MSMILGWSIAAGLGFVACLGIDLLGGHVTFAGSLLLGVCIGIASIGWTRSAP